MAKTKRTPKADTYTDECGRCLFDAVMEAYDFWLMGIPYVQPNNGHSVSVYTHDELAEQVWPPVEKLCIRLEANGQEALGSRVQQAYQDALDYARIIDNHCLSDKFDFWLWESGDPALNQVETDNADMTELVSKAEAIGACSLTDGACLPWSQGGWARAVADQAVQAEMRKYGSTPTEDYSKRTEMMALACFWLAVQLERRAMDHREAHKYLQSYLSRNTVVSETREPIIHEALGRAFGMHIYRLDPPEASKKGFSLPAVVVEVQEVLEGSGQVRQPAAKRRDTKSKRRAKKHHTRSKPRGAAKLNDTELNIVEALGRKRMTGEELAKKAGYPFNSNFRSTLSSMRKRDILENAAPRYFLADAFKYLLDECQGKGQD